VVGFDTEMTVTRPDGNFLTFEAMNIETTAAASLLSSSSSCYRFWMAEADASDPLDSYEREVFKMLDLSYDGSTPVKYGV